MKIWIVSGRIDGTEVMTPEIFYSEKEANAYADNYIADYVRDHIDEDGIDMDDDEAVLAWGEENDYCSGWIYTGASDWTVLQVTEHEIEI